MKAVDEKAVRLVVDRKVTVTWVGEGAGSGVVDGDHDTYQAHYSPAGYICTCPAGANHRTCSHARALELEVLRQQEGVAV